MKTRIGMTVIAVVLAAAAVVQASSFHAVPVQTGVAVGGATHELRLTYADLTDTNATTAQTIQGFSVAANQLVTLVAMQLVTPFDTGLGGADTNSLLLEVGDGTDADLFLASTQVASDGTEVYWKNGRANDTTVTPSVTQQRGTALNVDASTTNSLVVTNVTVTATGTAATFGTKLYTSADTVDVTFTPAPGSCDGQTAGEVVLYFRVWK